MARRKRVLEDDDSDSSNNSEQNYEERDANPDAAEERELFEDPYQQRKRRRLNGKEDDIYGVFADDDDEPHYRKTAPKKRAKTPTFISTKTVRMDVTEETTIAEGTDVDSDEQSESDSSLSDDIPSPPRNPIDEREDVEPEEVETLPRRGGIGARQAQSQTLPGGLGMFTKGSEAQDNIEPTQTKAGIGATSKPAPSPISKESLPSSFGQARNAFMRASNQSPAPTPVQLTAGERAQFAKVSGTYGARMLAKMGWTVGTGLGVEGRGRIAPVEAKLRPKGNVGIAFGGFKERTKQAIVEDRRKGIIRSDDEEERRNKRTGRKSRGDKDHQERSNAWRKKAKKTVVEYKTYEEIVEAVGSEAAPTIVAGVGPIIDATGATPREVSSLADVSNSWTPSLDPLRIPEIRHNVRLILDMTKQDLSGLAREGKTLAKRREDIKSEDLRLRKTIKVEADLISRLQRVQLIAEELGATAKLQKGSSGDLEAFSDSIEQLAKEYEAEYRRYNIDEVVIGAILPTFRAKLADWRPLEDPEAFTKTIRKWLPALKMSVRTEPEMQVDVYGTQIFIPQRVVEQPLNMMPYETLLWHTWLPKLRSAINNEWDPTEPTPAIALCEVWMDLIPPFMQDNILDQLILPKIQRAVGDWKPKNAGSVALHSIVFPWLPYVGLRIDDFLEDAKRKVKSMFKAVNISDGVSSDLLTWKTVFDSNDWESMVLKYIVPKLGSTLRDDFKVNPRNQNMEPLKWVFSWSSFVRNSVFSQLLETEFFPKWLDVLHFWLIQPNPSYEEIAQWYSFWKESFPPDILLLTGVQQGFKRGVELMDQALTMGDEARTKLPKPSQMSSNAATDSSNKPTRKQPPSRLTEVTFKTIAEEFAAEHNLLFLPSGQVHERARIPMYRVTGRTDGKGGIMTYVLDDVVWLVEDGTPRGTVKAITLEEMVLLAAKGKS